MKRPMFLTIWLILMVLGYVFTLYGNLFNTASTLALLPGIPSWYFPVMIALSVVALGAIYLIWTWKKLGFYIIVGLAVLNVVISFMVIGNLGLVSIFGAVIGVAILYLAMRPVWKNFK